MWHASAARLDRRPHEQHLRPYALAALAAVGDSALGEWRDWTGYAYHIRRRLSPTEQESIGEAIDLRGKLEGQDRFFAIKHLLPQRAVQMASEELI